MRLRPSIITAGAIVALAIPATAGAASTGADTAFKVAKETVSFHHGRAIHTGRTGKSAKHASSKSHAVYPVTYIYVSGPAGAVSVATDPNECQDNGSNCTDEQACEFWGMNCGTAATANQSASAQILDPAAGAVQTLPEVQPNSDTQAAGSTPTTGNSSSVDATDNALTNDLFDC